MAQDVILSWAAAIIAIGGAFGVLWKLITPLYRTFKKLTLSLELFMRDWFGEEAAPGRSKVPGVMERLSRIDGELKHNGGSSMKDSLKRIESELKAVQARLDEGGRQFNALDEKIHEIEDKLDS